NPTPGGDETGGALIFLGPPVALFGGLYFVAVIALGVWLRRRRERGSPRLRFPPNLTSPAPIQPETDSNRRSRLALVGLGDTLAGTIIGAVIGYESGRPSTNCSEFFEGADFSEVGAIIGGVMCVGI